MRRAYEEAKRDRDFAAVIGIPVQEVLLNRTDQLVAGQAAMQQQIAELKAMFAPQIATTITEYRLSREVVDRLLTMAGLAEIEPAAIPDAFDELARRFAVMCDALQRQGNDDPEIATLKQQASDALLSADLDAAERLLATIRARQRTLSEQRRRNADEAHADFMVAIKDEAGTCARQADAALLRLDVAAALDFYRDGGAVLGDGPPETRWEYIFLAAATLEEFGKRAVRNDALVACFDMYELALRDAGRNRVPRHWATTQTNLGRALATLGERESGTARLEEAIVCHRAALEELTHDRVPRLWAMTQNHLGLALAMLGDGRAGRCIWRRRSPPSAQHLRK